MEHHKLVLPEHLNPYGFLFGGYLLQWIDEIAYITALVEFPGHEFVTVSMDNVEFQHSIKKGEVLRFQVQRIRIGTTSVRYKVEVFGELRADDSSVVLFTTIITFVSVDKFAAKQPIKIDQSSLRDYNS